MIAEAIPLLHAEGLKLFVVEGDLSTDNDAKRIQKAGAPAFQVMTGTACRKQGLGGEVLCNIW